MTKAAGMLVSHAGGESWAFPQLMQMAYRLVIPNHRTLV